MLDFLSSLYKLLAKEDLSETEICFMDLYFQTEYKLGSPSWKQFDNDKRTQGDTFMVENWIQKIAWKFFLQTTAFSKNLEIKINSCSQNEFKFQAILFGSLVMGSGSKFVVWVTHLWVWKIYTKNHKFFPFGSKKISSGRVKKNLGQSRVCYLFNVGPQVCLGQIRLGSISRLFNHLQIPIIRTKCCSWGIWLIDN